MILAALILIISTALFFFYLQAACQRILRTRFEQEYFRSIVNANRLEFPELRKEFEEYGHAMDYARLRMTLKCDFLALTYLLKNAANVNQRYSRDEFLLMFYFRTLFATVAARRLMRLGEKKAVLKLTAILEYFANVVGRRVNQVRFGNLTPSDYLLEL
jgi:hypothetical protein